MTDLALKRENDRGIIFANRPVLAVFTGLVFLGAGWAIYVYAADGPRGLFLAIFGAVGVASFFAAFRRERLVFDLAQRRYMRETGYWPRVRAVSGPLEDVEHVTLTTKVRSRSARPGSGARRYRVWIVSIKFRGDEKPLRVFEERREQNGYARFESLARTLRAPAVDRTGPEEKITPWERVGEPLAERLGSRADSWASAEIPPLPRASRIRLADGAGRRRIVLPAHGFTLWAPVLFVLPAVFITLGGALVGESLAVASAGRVLFGAAFFLIGVFFAFVFLASVFGKEWIAEERDRLVVTKDLFGMTWHRQETAKRDVEEIEIKAGRRPPWRRVALGVGGITVGRRERPEQPEHQEVMLRSRQWVRRLGAHLRQREREWLRIALTAMVQ